MLRFPSPRTVLPQGPAKTATPERMLPGYTPIFLDRSGDSLGVSCTPVGSWLE